MLAYIGKHLKSLRSLVVTVYDESDAFADFDARPRRHPLLITTIKNRHESREEFERMCLSAVNKLVERWNMRWLRALAKIMGLSTFQAEIWSKVSGRAHWLRKKFCEGVWRIEFVSLGKKSQWFSCHLQKRMAKLTLVSPLGSPLSWDNEAVTRPMMKVSGADNNAKYITPIMRWSSEF